MKKTNFPDLVGREQAVCDMVLKYMNLAYLVAGAYSKDRLGFPTLSEEGIIELAKMIRDEAESWAD